MLRTGLGVDTHAFAPGRPLILGGVAIPHEAGLAGHSDADVLTHAVIDALLGAAGLGDIGQLFPDTDAAFAGVDSLELLRDVVGRLERDGGTIGNVDATVVMERPKLGPHRERIRAALADALGVERDAVNVKATTGEGMGFVGRGEGVAAVAVATVKLERSASEPSGAAASET
jgi:2-C-methyl-D-erythritol 2,4-cyclodiphosphate synthase